jgi:hypothetical protein
MNGLERRLEALERRWVALEAPGAILTDSERAAILTQWVERGWIVQTEAGSWEGRADDGAPADCMRSRDEHRRALMAELLNRAEARRRQATLDN